MQNNQSAKFAFFYLLSLVALLFTALSAGTIIFEIINKYITDFAASYSGRFHSDSIKFAISALVVSIPVFYVTTVQIQKNLFLGKMDPESAIRRWLTYLIFFVTSIVMIFWIIITINSFLSGELTLKFGLKFLTVLVIASTVFGYYFHDIRREKFVGEKDKIIKSFFWTTLIALIAIFVTGLLVVDSPWETRKRNLDNEVVRHLSSLERGVEDYYNDEGEMPGSLDDVEDNSPYIDEKNLVDPETGEKYEYKILSGRNYELCANFRTTNKEVDPRITFPRGEWEHEEGYECFDLEVDIDKDRSSPKAID